MCTILQIEFYNSPVKWNGIQCKFLCVPLEQCASHSRLNYFPCTFQWVICLVWKQISDAALVHKIPRANNVRFWLSLFILNVLTNTFLAARPKSLKKWNIKWRISNQTEILFWQPGPKTLWDKVHSIFT